MGMGRGHVILRRDLARQTPRVSEARPVSGGPRRTRNLGPPERKGLPEPAGLLPTGWIEAQRG